MEADRELEDVHSAALRGLERLHQASSAGGRALVLFKTLAIILDLAGILNALTAEARAENGYYPGGKTNFNQAPEGRNNCAD